MVHTRYKPKINLYPNLSLLRVIYKTIELLPDLITALPHISSDGLKYADELKNNMTWDDKTPITARDIIFTTKDYKCLYTNIASFKAYWKNIQDILLDSTNYRKFTIVMNKPYILNT